MDPKEGKILDEHARAAGGLCVDEDLDGCCDACGVALVDCPDCLGLGYHHDTCAGCGPEPDDYVLTPSGPLGSRLYLSLHEGRYLAEFAGDDQEGQAQAYIRARMARENFWPNVWYVSDHGNVRPFDLGVQS